MNGENSIERLRKLEQQKMELQAELRKLKRKPEGRIGYLLLLLGLTLITLAIVYSHNVSAFIGIALTFWGALLLYIRPTQFIRKDILDLTIIEQLKYINKLLDELSYTGTPTYISPETLSDLRTATIYITESAPPTDEELSNEDIFLQNLQIIKITPPGLGLSRLLEDELKTNFSTVNLEYLQNNIEKAIVEGLEIAEAFEMEVSEPTVQVKLKNTIFDTIIKELNETENQRLIGDPLSSAIACVLARSTHRPITIEKIEKQPKQKTTQITFKIGNPQSLEGKESI
jgi:hypothetical protein